MNTEDLIQELSILTDNQFSEVYKGLEPIDKWRFYRVINFMRSRGIGDWDEIYKKKGVNI